jgi:cytochrome oxidase assembly protein ShyY1
VGKYFSSRLLAIHLIAILAIVACGVLSVWQWQRSHYIRESRQLNKVVPFEKLSTARDYLPPSSISAKTIAVGTWQPAGRFYLSKRPVDGQLLIDTPEHVRKLRQASIGTWVVDLLNLKDGTAVAVVRGWTSGATYSVPATGSARVTGTVQPAEDAPGATFSSTPEQLTTSLVLKHSATSVRDGFIIASSPTTELKNVVPSRGPLTSNGLHWRNVVYTINWIFFAILAFFMWIRVVREEVSDTHATGE